MAYEKGVRGIMDEKGPFHFIGIGGISMSGIARLLLQLGYSVSGSDLTDSPLLEGLRQYGARIEIGHDPAHLQDARVCVVSSAIPSHNVELKAAQDQGLPVWPRAQMIARLMEKKQGVAIAGTHGKTTTTSMISLLLEHVGMDPTVLIGGELNDLGGNAKLGAGDLLITEADESDGSLLYFHPHMAVITNIELDHPDFYTSQSMLDDVFSRFIDQVRGPLIVCADDKGIERLLEEKSLSSPVLQYGMKKGDLKVESVEMLPFSSRIVVQYQGKRLGRIHLQVPGIHNINNALAVLGVGLSLGLSFKELKEGLELYVGVQRRFERKGEEDGVLVIDDYAHHPTEIRATLEAAFQCEPNRIIAVFQPHRYSRTYHLIEEFSQAFQRADQVIITSIYGAGEEPIPHVSGEGLARRMQSNGQNNVTYIDDRKDIAGFLASRRKKGDLILTMGAGDIHKTGTEFLSLMHSVQSQSLVGG